MVPIILELWRNWNKMNSLDVFSWWVTWCNWWWWWRCRRSDWLCVWFNSCTFSSLCVHCVVCASVDSARCRVSIRQGMTDWYENMRNYNEICHQNIKMFSIKTRTCHQYHSIHHWQSIKTVLNVEMKKRKIQILF